MDYADDDDALLVYRKSRAANPYSEPVAVVRLL
jgi:hypothetical protein